MSPAQRLTTSNNRSSKLPTLICERDLFVITYLPTYLNYAPRKGGGGSGGDDFAVN